MTAAISRIITFTNPINRNTICTAILAAAALAGLDLVQDFAATALSDRSLIFRFIYPGSPASFLEIRVTNGRGISSRIYKDWNTTGSSVATAYSPVVILFTIGIVQIIAINHLEARLLLISQRTVFQVCGILRPDFKPQWWNEISFPFAFQPNINFTVFSNWLPAVNNPYNSSVNYSLLAIASLNARTPVNEADVIAGAAIINSPNATGVSGIFGPDFALCTATGLNRADMLGAFLVLNPAVSGLAIASNVPN
jgi:hypothetical protein